jgi:hypothetical protein
MPQLNEAKASQVHDTENKGGTLDPGVYPVTLLEVEARPGRVAPQWSWKFEVSKGHARAGRTLYTNTSLSDDALWKLRETFDAFGVDSTVNTDTLIGRQVRALVTKQIQTEGKRQGQFVNQIQELMPLSGSAPSPTGPVKVSANGGSPNPDDEPPF